MDDILSLTGVLAAFITVFKKAGPGAALGGGGLALVFLTWQFSTSVGKVAVGASPHAILMQLIVSLVLTICVWHVTSLTSGLANGMSALGARVSQGTLTGNIMSNPGKITNLGWAALKEQWQRAGAVEGIVANIKQLPVSIVLVIALFAFAATAIIAIKTVVVTNAKILVGSALTPLLILPISRPIGMAGVGMIVGAASELAIKSVLIGVGYGVLMKLKIPANADLHDIVLATGKAAAVAWICAAEGTASAVVGAAAAALPDKRKG